MWISRSTQTRLKMTSYKFRVVLCRIRPFPTLSSKLKWLGSWLPLNFCPEKCSKEFRITCKTYFVCTTLVRFKEKKYGPKLHLRSNSNTWFWTPSKTFLDQNLKYRVPNSKFSKNGKIGFFAYFPNRLFLINGSKLQSHSCHVRNIHKLYTVMHHYSCFIRISQTVFWMSSCSW